MSDKNEQVITHLQANIVGLMVRISVLEKLLLQKKIIDNDELDLKTKEILNETTKKLTTIYSAMGKTSKTPGKE